MHWSVLGTGLPAPRLLSIATAHRHYPRHLRQAFNQELYVLLAGWENNGESASFQVYINPLINWIWVGGIIVIVGFFLAYWKMPEGDAAPVRAPARRAAGAPAR